MNIGYSSRQIYDKDYYEGRIRESTSPLKYQVSLDQVYNCGGCLQDLTIGGVGVSTIIDPSTKKKYAEKQYLTDLESVMTNRNVKLSKAQRAKTNPVDITKLGLYDKKGCDKQIHPEHSRLTHPSKIYRGIGINRFYNTIHNAQDTIYWDWGVNTQLEAKDNFVPTYPVPMSIEGLLPKEFVGPVEQPRFPNRRNPGRV